MKLLAYSLVPILAFLLSCQYYDVDPENSEVPTPRSEEVCLDEFPVCFVYETLDELGRLKTEFKEGENIVLSFEIRNTSDTDITLKNHDIFMGNPEFMFLRDDQERPIVHLTKDIAFSYISHFSIPANDSYKFQISYYNDPNLVGQSLGPNNKYPIQGPFLEEPVPVLDSGMYQSTFTNEYILRFANEEREYKVSLPLSLRFYVQ